jgi:hypothetical protein
VYAHSLLIGTLRMEMGDVARIVCPKTGYSAEIDFHMKVRGGSHHLTLLQHSATPHHLLAFWMCIFFSSWCVVSVVTASPCSPRGLVQPTFGGADKVNAVSGTISGPEGEFAKLDGHWDNIVHITIGGKKVRMLMC